MSDNTTISIISSITGLIATIYILLKVIKKINTPCFKIELNDNEKDANLLQYIIYKSTPRKSQKIELQKQHEETRPSSSRAAFTMRIFL
jgi:hypothetical protein